MESGRILTGRTTRSPCVHMQFNPVGGNRLHLFTDGDEAFAAADEAMRTAGSRIWLETYIYEPDEVGDTVRDRLMDAALRGCDVMLIFDRWGSPRIDARYVKPIVDAGGRVAMFNPLIPWRRIGRRIAPFRHRDHRKILIADDVAFCGGANVSTDYGGPGPEKFYDMVLRIEGPAVRDIARVYAETFRRISRVDAVAPEAKEGAVDSAAPEAEDGAVNSAAPEAEALPAVSAESAHTSDPATVQVLALDHRHGREDLNVAVRRLVESAGERCWIMTPYFIPPRWFVSVLADASALGVDVRLLTAGRSDVPLARVAGRHLYKRLLRAGIRVFEKQEPILHAKCIVVDGRESIVGSYNVDAYGSRRNLEIGVATTDVTLADRLEREFEARCAESEEVDLEAWLGRSILARAGEWLLHMLFRI